MQSQSRRITLKKSGFGIDDDGDGRARWKPSGRSRKPHAQRAAVMSVSLAPLETTRTWPTMTKNRRQAAAGPLAAVRISPIHGRGLFALRNIAAEQQIGVYEGRRYASEADRDWDHALTYVFGLSDGTVIDGSEGGNDSRHINHSCEPNCAAYEIEHDDGTLAIVIETLRPIQRGEELLLDYALDVGPEDRSDYPCACGTPKCRGTMVAA
jgi:uncharacterized protein